MYQSIADTSITTYHKAPAIFMCREFHVWTDMFVYPAHPVLPAMMNYGCLPNIQDDGGIHDGEYL